jgi:hypothetical protein
MTQQQAPARPFKSFPSTVANYWKVIMDKGRLPIGGIFQLLTSGKIEITKS